MSNHGILAEANAEAAAVLGSEFVDIRLRRAVIGVYFTGVALNCETAGAASTPSRGELHVTCCPTGEETVLAPGTLAGRRAVDVLDELYSPHPLKRVVAIATLNALAEACWQRRPDPRVDLSEGDAFKAAAIAPGEHVVLVGAFVPFLKALKRMRQPYTVVELNPSMLKPEELPHYRPATEAAAAIPEGDVVLLTGITLFSDSLELLLGYARPGARIVVVGPTVGMLPGPFLDRGVDLLGGVRVTRPDAFLDALAEAAAPQHFLGRTAERVVLKRRAAKVG